MKRHEPRLAAHEKDNERPNPGKNQLQGVGQCRHGAFILRRFKATSAETPGHFVTLHAFRCVFYCKQVGRGLPSVSSPKTYAQSRIAANCNPAVSSDYSDAEFSGGETLTSFY